MRLSVKAAVAGAMLVGGNGLTNCRQSWLTFFLLLLSRLRNGLRQVLTISQLGNGLIQANKPWVLVKGTPDERYVH